MAKNETIFSDEKEFTLDGPDNRMTYVCFGDKIKFILNLLLLVNKVNFCEKHDNAKY